MATFVTGGTGFIGEHVIRFLTASGETVHMLLRGPEKAVLYPDNVRRFIGDITDEASVRNAMRGCNHVIHLAAFCRAWTRDASLFYRVNVAGTRNVFEGAAREGIEKLIYTSSCSAIQLNNREISDESSIRPLQRPSSEYARSKSLAEAEVQKFLSWGLPIVTVYPATVYGPGKLTEANAATRAISLYMQGRLPLVLGDGTQISSWSYVEDVARGAILAIERGTAGRRYFLGGENASLIEVWHLIDKITGKRHFKFHVPMRCAYLFASFEELKANIFHSSPFVTRGWVKSLNQSSPLSSAAAMNELGYRITPLEPRLRKTLQWLDQHRGHHTRVQDR